MALTDQEECGSWHRIVYRSHLPFLEFKCSRPKRLLISSFDTHSLMVTLYNIALRAQMKNDQLLIDNQRGKYSLTLEYEGVYLQCQSWNSNVDQINTVTGRNLADQVFN